MSTSTQLSPYADAATISHYCATIHFRGAAEVWEAFFAKQISSKRREELLSVLRTRLSREVPLAK